MAPKFSSRLSSALLPLGIVALVAGCGGGSLVSKGDGSTTFVPPSPQKMTKATLTLTIPARRSSSARRPHYVGPGTQSISIQVAAASAASPWPSPTATSVPTPAASPIAQTLTVDVPLGSDIFVVNTYDGPVSGGVATGALISGVTSTPVPILNDTTNQVNLTLNVDAACAQINHGAGFTMTPLMNQVQPQTATFTVTPCDVDGYPITSGPIGNTLVLATPSPGPPSPPPGPVFSPSVISASGDTVVTETFPAGLNTGSTEWVGPAATIATNHASVITDPIYFLAVSNAGANSVSLFATDIYVGFMNPVGTVTVGASPAAIVAGSPLGQGCAGAGELFTGNSGSMTILTEPSPGPGNPTPLPVATTVTGGGYGQTSGGTIDSSCVAYFGDNNGYLASITSASTYNFNRHQYQNTYDVPIFGLAAVGGHEYAGLGPVPSLGYLSNIKNETGADQSVGNTTYAMIPYDVSTLAVAYRPNNAGDYHVAQFVPGLYPSLAHDLDLSTAVSSQSTVVGMAKDAFGNVWGVVSGTPGPASLFKYNPGLGTLAAWQLPAGHTNPSGITASRDGGSLFITNSTTNQLDQYSASNPNAGSGSLAVVVNSYATGSQPSGVTIAP